MKQQKKQLAHLFDATQCISCGACMVACAQTNYPDILNGENTAWKALPSNIRRIRIERETGPKTLLIQCQQCSDAPCIKACPFGANWRDENGLIRTDAAKCVGCDYCVTACPYGIRWPHPTTGVPMKCMGSGCLELIGNGQQPACVAACPAQARVFGDILDPKSDISRRIRKSCTVKILEDKGTKPNFFVVVSK